ncbi:hypothetical protein JOS77_13945 [Chromobacterium haemolyticum]|nr:hypothetical protein JOS77_13945 [Chromobacterium haemolyticum]
MTPLNRALALVCGLLFGGLLAFSPRPPRALALAAACAGVAVLRARRCWGWFCSASPPP